MEIDAFFNLISTVALILALTGNILINFKKKQARNPTGFRRWDEWHW